MAKSATTSSGEQQSSLQQTGHPSFLKSLLWWQWMLVVLFMLFGVGVGLFFVGRSTKVPSQVSGTIDFTKLKPDPTDEGTVSVLYREYGTQDAFIDTKASPALTDNAPWHWESAQAGVIYEMKAQLTIDGKNIGTAEPVTVTAPASNVVLPIAVTWNDLPAEVVSQQEADISGNVVVQGIIPESASIQVRARTQDQPANVVIATLDDISENNPFLWTRAVPLKPYILTAVLFENGTPVGESEAELAEAGENEVSLTIASKAQPAPTPTPTPAPTTAPTNPTPAPTPKPVSKGTISGTVYMNGPLDANSSILLLYRTPGIGDYKVMFRIEPAQASQAWTWKDAVAGQQYEVQAALQVSEQNTGTARSQIVTAPASNINFTINTGVHVNTPGAQPSLENCRQIDSNNWDATVKFPNIPEAGMFWFQIGRNPAASDLVNEKVARDANQPERRYTVRVDNNKSYWAQYATAHCTNCTADQNFSQFSSPFEFKCGG